MYAKLLNTMLITYSMTKMLFNLFQRKSSNNRKETRKGQQVV